MLLALSGCQAASPPVAAAPASPVQQYAQQVSGILNNPASIPPALAQSGMSGVVHLSVVIAPSGATVTAFVEQSSGTPALDNQAMDEVAAAHFPPFLPGMPPQPVTFSIPVNFPG